EDNLVFDNFDILEETVHFTAITRSAFVEVTDGVLNFDLIPVTSVAIIRGIEILESEEPADTTPPVITLLGDAEMTVEQGDPFTDPGVTASDDRDGDLTDDVVVSGDTVDTNTLGTYVITYDVSDAAGNAATQVTRTVNVVEPSPYLYRVNANGASDIDMGDEPPFLALPSGNLTAIPGLTVTSSGTLTNATTPNVFTNLPE